MGTTRCIAGDTGPHEKKSKSEPASTNCVRAAPTDGAQLHMTDVRETFVGNAPG